MSEGGLINTDCNFFKRDKNYYLYNFHIKSVAIRGRMPGKEDAWMMESEETRVGGGGACKTKRIG